jgi:hypothetical protein
MKSMQLDSQEEDRKWEAVDQALAGKEIEKVRQL